MDDFLKRLDADYSARRDDRSRRAAVWSELCAHYPPSIEACAADTPPSTLFARDAGDLGIAVLWIVQAALVRPIASEVGVPGTAFSSPASIGALAHSEDPARPMRVAMDRGRPTLFGHKKYITGGLDADWIIITATEENETGPRAVYVRTADLPAGALEEIELGMLGTTSHARLSLSGQSPEGAVLLPADGRAVRRAVGRWGIVERALILEAFGGLCSYLAGRIGRIKIQARIDELIAAQSLSRRGQVEAAMAGRRIEPRGSDMAELVEISAKIAEAAADLTEEESRRLDDLKLARLFSPGTP